MTGDAQPSPTSGDAPNAPKPARPPSGLDLIGGWRAWTLDGLLLPGASPQLGAQLCDARVRTIVLDPDGLPLSLSRTARLFRDHQRHTLAIRDGGCTFPGCPLPATACNAHHIQQWERDQGPTDIVNGALLCPRDHGIAHRTGWNMFITPDGWTWYRTPTGHTFWGQRHGHQRTGPTPDHPDYTPRQPTTATHPPPTRPARGRPPPTTDEPSTAAPPPNAADPPPHRHRARPPATRDEHPRRAATLATIRSRLRADLLDEPTG